MDITGGIVASQQDGSYPRPQMMRAQWVDLCGEWSFGYDDENLGLEQSWFTDTRFDRTITVPFPPESTASGIGDRTFHPVVWYSRELDEQQLPAANDGERHILHFGAVDYRASVWIDGAFLGSHEGGHTPFSFDITTALEKSRASHTLVVRAEDDPVDVSQPRGKQDWLLEPHDVWYDRTTGIWQPVWVETVPAAYLAAIRWTPDVAGARVLVTGSLNRAATGTLTVSLEQDGTALGTATAPVSGTRFELSIAVPLLSNGQGYERLLWSPEHPRLVDAAVTLDTDYGSDTVASYFGLRTVAAERGQFLLNDRPYRQRSVLSQGFWPQSHLASPSADALRAEVQLIKDLGFNAARVHQKIEDPRFLFWADRLGLLVWEEMPSAFEFSADSVRRATTEWMAAIERDVSHPCIVTWVPLNESWGVQHISVDPHQSAYASALFHLTRAFDDSRPVISNDGWEHTESDIWSIHDYEASGDVMRERYSDVAPLFSGFGPAGRRLRVTAEPDRGQPVMLTEFGGIRFAVSDAHKGTWGYSSADSPEDYERRLTDLLTAVSSRPALSGWCFTQLTDTQQEANGLCDENRVPKLPVETLARIIRGA